MRPARLFPVLVALCSLIAFPAAASAAPPTAADLDGLQFRHTAGVMYNDGSAPGCNGTWLQWLSTNNEIAPFHDSAAGWAATQGLYPELWFSFAEPPGTFEHLDSTLDVQSPDGSTYGVTVSAPGPGGNCVNPQELLVGQSFRAAATWSSPGSAGGPARVAIKRTSEFGYVETVGFGSAARRTRTRCHQDRGSSRSAIR